MTLIQKIEHWGDVHHYKWLAILRVVLGLIILGKGISFISDTERLQELLWQHNVFNFSAVLISVVVHIVAFAHLVGGIMIIIGLMTRFFVVIQIPILISAVFFVNITRGFSAPTSEWWLSAIVLLLLILFWIIGGGPLSADESLKHTKGKRYD
jgi:putative oxidoreductase